MKSTVIKQKQCFYNECIDQKYLFLICPGNCTNSVKMKIMRLKYKAIKWIKNIFKNARQTDTEKA